MSLQQLFLILRSRYRIALLAMAVTMALTLVVSLLLPKRYVANTAVVVDIKTPDPLGGVLLPPTAMPSYIPTQIDIINSERVAQRVVKLLKLDQNQAVREQWMEATDGRGRLDVWLAQLLQSRLVAKPSRESNVINITYSSEDAGFSAAIANAFAQAYIDTNVELKADPARSYSEWFQTQGKVMRDNLERAQARLAEYQQKEGIVVTDERLDHETSKLAELTTQLAVAEGMTADARSKQAFGGNSSLPEIAMSPVVMNLRADVARMEAKLQEAAVNLGRNHPQYQRMESEIRALKQKLDAETQNVRSGFTASRGVGKDRENNLRQLIETQKQRLFELKSQRDQAGVLLTDVATAQKAYDAVLQRVTQMNLEGKVTQTNISVLTPATEPLDPASPKPLLYTLIAGVVGLLIGSAVAFGREMSDRRVRSSEDLEYGLGFALPVLARLERPRAPRSRWLRLGRRGDGRGDGQFPALPA